VLRRNQSSGLLLCRSKELSPGSVIQLLAGAFHSLAYAGESFSNLTRHGPLLLRFRRDVCLEEPDKFREVGRSYIRHSPELEAAI
jgi:hypothetical protein